MPTTDHSSRRSALAVVAALLCAGGLGACGDDDAAETTAATTAACRAIQLNAASLDAAQARLSDRRAGPGPAQDYDTAIARATEAAAHPDIDDDVVEATSSLIEAWSRSRAAAHELAEVGDVEGAAFGPTPGEVSALIGAERRLLDELDQTCRDRERP